MLIKVPRFLPFRRRIVQVVLQGDSQPLHLRLGSTDFWVLEEIFAENEYGMVPDETVRPGGLVVDLGANIGLSVRYWQNRWPSCRVVAVEPHPENAKLCAVNAPALRDARECRLIEACVGAAARRASIVTDYGDWAHKLAPPGLPGGQVVNVITMQDIMSALPDGEVIDLLKCDIEGAEQELFDGCKPWIDRVRCIVVEIHPPYSLQSIVHSLMLSGTHFDIDYKCDKGVFELAVFVNRAL